MINCKVGIVIKVFNMYILLRALLHAFLIDDSYKDPSIFIFHVWVFAGYITIPSM